MGVVTRADTNSHHQHQASKWQQHCFRTASDSTLKRPHPYPQQLNQHQSQMGQRYAKHQMQSGVQLYHAREQERAIARWRSALSRLRRAEDRFITLGYIAQAYCDVGDYETMLHYALEQMQLANERRDDFMRSEGFLTLAKAYERLSDFAKAISYGRASLQHPNVDARTPGYAYLVVALAQLGHSDYSDALREFGEAMRVANSTGDRLLELQTCIGLGALFSSLQDQRKALVFLRNALSLLELVHVDTVHAKYKAAVLAQLSVVLRHRGALADAREACEEALKLAQSTANRSVYARALCSLADVNRELGESEAMETITKSWARYEQAYRLVHEINDRMGEIVILSSMAKAASESRSHYAGQCECQAIQLNKKCLELAREIGCKHAEMKCHMRLQDLYSQLADEDGEEASAEAICSLVQQMSLYCNFCGQRYAAASAESGNESGGNGESLQALPCSHIFHERCLAEQLARSSTLNDGTELNEENLGCALSSDLPTSSSAVRLEKVKPGVLCPKCEAAGVQTRSQNLPTTSSATVGMPAQQPLSIIPRSGATMLRPLPSILKPAQTTEPLNQAQHHPSSSSREDNSVRSGFASYTDQTASAAAAESEVVYANLVTTGVENSHNHSSSGSSSAATVLLKKAQSLSPQMLEAARRREAGVGRLHHQILTETPKQELFITSFTSSSVEDFLPATTAGEAEELISEQGHSWGPNIGEEDGGNAEQSKLQAQRQQQRPTVGGESVAATFVRSTRLTASQLVPLLPLSPMTEVIHHHRLYQNNEDVDATIELAQPYSAMASILGNTTPNPPSCSLPRSLAKKEQGSLPVERAQHQRPDPSQNAALPNNVAAVVNEHCAHHYFHISTNDTTSVERDVRETKATSTGTDAHTATSHLLFSPDGKPKGYISATADINFGGMHGKEEEERKFGRVFPPPTSTTQLNSSALPPPWRISSIPPSEFQAAEEGEDGTSQFVSGEGELSSGQFSCTYRRVTDL